MTRALNIVQRGLPDWRLASSYEPSPESAIATSLQLPAALSPSIPLISDADRLTISPQGLKAQARQDLNALSELLKQKKESELTPQQQQLVEKLKTADRKPRALPQAILEAKGNLGEKISYFSSTSESTIPGSLTPNGNSDHEGSVHSDSHTFSQSLSTFDPTATVSAQYVAPSDPLIAQTQAITAKASAELFQRVTTFSSGIGLIAQNIGYSRLSESNSPMWIDVFA